MSGGNSVCCSKDVLINDAFAVGGIQQDHTSALQINPECLSVFDSLLQMINDCQNSSFMVGRVETNLTFTTC